MTDVAHSYPESSGGSSVWFDFQMITIIVEHE